MDKTLSSSQQDQQQDQDDDILQQKQQQQVENVEEPSQHQSISQDQQEKQQHTDPTNTTGSSDNENDESITITKLQKNYAWFVSDVLVYIIILNLASEWVESIVVRKFSISLLVAVVLKILLSIISSIEQYIHHLVCDVYHRKLLGAFCMWFIIFVSKFVILWIDDIIFSEQVELGSFWEIVLLSFVLVISSLLSRWFFHQLGKWNPPTFKFCTC